MLGKNFKYNWYDMSASNVKNTKCVLTNVESRTGQNTNIVNNANNHWSVASNTLETWRAFVFSWYIFGLNKIDRWDKRKDLVNLINIEPYVNNNPFKKLEFQNDYWDALWCMSKVNEKPVWTNWVNDPRIIFDFTLYCDSNEIYWKTLKNISWLASSFWGTSFPNSLWDSWGNYTWWANCENLGNFKAWCEIQVLWNMVNPSIRNVTNWQFFKINWTTTNLILNSLLWTWEVTDEWTDIMYKRDSGTPIYLSPWNNKILVIDDNDNQVNFNVSWYDTWNTL